uniref:Ig-like domain-containing protein n=1 Tax=Sinocyclocheilus grahami TaxID=75366 RepID=A0A672Q6U4_SINGR
MDNKGTEKNSQEKETVKLSCSYSTSNYLYWYRQYPGSAPEFLELILDGTTKTKKSDVDPRLSVKLTKQEQKHVDLKISSAAVSDSALYYCALRPTVTGNIWVPYKNPLPSERDSKNRADKNIVTQERKKCQAELLI